MTARKDGRKRWWLNGRAPAFQAGNAGPIPVHRSMVGRPVISLQRTMSGAVGGVCIAYDGSLRYGGKGSPANKICGIVRVVYGVGLLNRCGEIRRRFKSFMPRQYAQVAERSMAAVQKTEAGKLAVGSNPTLRANGASQVGPIRVVVHSAELPQPLRAAPSGREPLRGQRHTPLTI